MTNLLIDRIRHTRQWVSDIDTPEFISTLHYKKEYLAFDGSISAADLVLIVTAVNHVLEVIHSSRRINWSMGEIIPAGVSENHDG